MMENNLKYAATQNGVILDIFETQEEAIKRCREEIARDFASILLKRKLRKVFKNSGNIALHRYLVLTIVKAEEVSTK